MKNAFGATLIFQIVIVFVIIFTGYICISINQAKAFNMKNEIVKAIERYAPDLDNTHFSEYIEESLMREGYRLTGECSEGYDGYDEFGRKTYNSNGTFCVKKITVSNSGLSGSYYKVETFYHLEIPIIQSLFNLKAAGETKVIYSR